MVALAAARQAGCSDDGRAPSTRREARANRLLFAWLLPTVTWASFPALTYFVEQVEEISDGEIRIEIVGEWGDAADDAEAAVVRGVAEGDVDLGWAGSRVFDTLGVSDFQALTAPMLVDSMPCRAR